MKTKKRFYESMFDYACDADMSGYYMSGSDFPDAEEGEEVSFPYSPVEDTDFEIFRDDVEFVGEDNDEYVRVNWGEDEDSYIPHDCLCDIVFLRGIYEDFDSDVESDGSIYEN